MRPRVGVGGAPARTPVVGRTRTVAPDPRALRRLSARAERRYDTREVMEWDDVTSEPDDAPSPDEVPEWAIGDNDDPQVGPDSRAPWEEVGIDRLPRPRVAIFLRADGSLDQEVFLQMTGDPVADRALEEMYDKWERVAEMLIEAHPEALRELTLLGAFRALRPFAMKELETSQGQGSRDRLDLVRTPFGIVPLWFFSLGKPRARNNDMFRDLEVLGTIIVRDGLTRLSKGDIERVLPRSRANAEALRKHGPALLAVTSRPGVVAKHREMWPVTTLDDLNSDLGREGVEPKSEEVLSLALFGAFERVADHA